MLRKDKINKQYLKSHRDIKNSSQKSQFSKKKILSTKHHEYKHVSKIYALKITWLLYLTYILKIIQDIYFISTKYSISCFNWDHF